jgi:hypothetical protein
MNEKEKLAEANFYLSKMNEEKNNSEHFKFYLSAFLSASRCVLQYAWNEIKSNNHLLWYNDYVSKHPPLGFFKERRDINIHSSPVNPSLNVNVKLYDSITMSESVRIIKRDKDGNVISDETFEGSKPAEVNTENRGSVDYIYTFDEWSGNEDVPTLCQTYLNELLKFTAEAQSKGYIT